MSECKTSLHYSFFKHHNSFAILYKKKRSSRIRPKTMCVSIHQQGALSYIVLCCTLYGILHRNLNRGQRYGTRSSIFSVILSVHVWGWFTHIYNDGVCMWCAPIVPDDPSKIGKPVFDFLKIKEVNEKTNEDIDRVILCFRWRCESSVFIWIREKRKQLLRWLSLLSDWNFLI